MTGGGYREGGDLYIYIYMKKKSDVAFQEKKQGGKIHNLSLYYRDIQAA